MKQMVKVNGQNAHARETQSEAVWRVKTPSPPGTLSGTVLMAIPEKSPNRCQFGFAQSQVGIFLSCVI